MLALNGLKSQVFKHIVSFKKLLTFSCKFFLLDSGLLNVVENSFLPCSSSSFPEDSAKNRTVLCLEMYEHVRLFFAQRS